MVENIWVLLPWLCVFVFKAIGKNPSGRRQDCEDVPRTPIMQYRPLIQRHESVTRSCRLNWPLNPFCNFLDLPLFLCSFLLPLSPLSNVPPTSHRTHRFHTQTPTSRQQPNGLPSASYCCWSGFVFVFDALTLVHKAQEDSCSLETDTHTHSHTLVPSWRVPLWDLGHLLQLLSEPWCHCEDTQYLFIISPHRHKHTLLNTAQTNTHSVWTSEATHAGIGHYKAGEGIIIITFWCSSVYFTRRFVFNTCCIVL